MPRIRWFSLAIAAAALAPASAQAAAPSPPTGPQLERVTLRGQSLSVRLACERAVTIAAGSQTRTVACRGGRAVARLTGVRAQGGRLVVRVNGRRTALPISRPGKAAARGYRPGKAVARTSNWSTLARAGCFVPNVVQVQPHAEYFGFVPGTQVYLRYWVQTYHERSRTYGWAHSTDWYPHLAGVTTAGFTFPILSGYWAMPGIEVWRNGSSRFDYVTYGPIDAGVKYSNGWCFFG